MNTEFEVFDNVKFSDILKKVYTNSGKKDRQINQLIAQLVPLITKDPSSATIVVPLIKDYLDISVKNDDHIVKLAAIVQRVVSSTTSVNDDSGLSEEEKKQLLQSIKDEAAEEIDTLEKDTKEINKQVSEIQKKDSIINESN